MLRYRPDLATFRQLASTANTVPVYCQLLSDNLTPVSAFARIARQTDHAFLLESVIGGEKIARYSFIAANPRELFEASGHNTTIQRAGAVQQLQARDPLAVLQEQLGRYRAVHLPGLPRFTGGAVGFAAYDVVRYYEPLPHAPPDDRHLPDLLFGIYDTMVIFDHVVKTITVLSHAHLDEGPIEPAYAAACGRIEQMAALLASPPAAGIGQIDVRGQPTIAFQSNFRREEFERAVDACLEYIRAGDIFQVVLSQRLCVQTQTDPFHVYRALRVINPSPFMFYLKSPQVILVGASPEIMCRVEDGVMINRPLAGTRPRGRTEQEDRELEKDLLADPKERAEHVMLVDLGRNDVGRVARPGTVELTEIMAVERYSHVMHISSEIRGKLPEDKTAFDALRAALPVGTVSGAPKVRAMQIIDEFEPTRRGPYAGAVGYIDFAGNMDTCIALRTLVIQGTSAYAQVGAGIVADSIPANEYEETINKARGLLKAIEVAQTGFD
jgi:anthranilate synthase component 1